MNRTFLSAYRMKCKNGYTWETEMAANFEEAKRYFLGSRINTAPFPQEIMSEVIEVKKIA